MYSILEGMHVTLQYVAHSSGLQLDGARETRVPEEREEQRVSIRGSKLLSVPHRERNQGHREERSMVHSASTIRYVLIVSN